MQQQRITRQHSNPARSTKATRQANQQAGLALLVFGAVFCGVAWFILQLAGSSPTTTGVVAGNGTSAIPIAPSPVAINVTGNTPAESMPAAPVAVAPSAPAVTTPDPMTTLSIVLQEQGSTLLLVGGSVVGAAFLLVFFARAVTRIPSKPLETGLARALTLLDTDFRAGRLTPQRAIEVARQVESDLRQAHDTALAARSQEYETTVARLTDTQRQTLASVQADAQNRIRLAEDEARRAALLEVDLLRRTEVAERESGRLSAELTQVHGALRDAHGVVAEQTQQIEQQYQEAEEAAELLLTLQTGNQALVQQVTSLEGTNTALTTQLQETQAQLASAQQVREKAEAQLALLQTEIETLTKGRDSVQTQLSVAEKELARVRAVSLRELPLTVPEREADLLPHLIAFVSQLRGTTLDSGAADGERTQRPLLQSWREMRRLLQVLRGTGVRLAVPAHHIPKWAESAFAIADTKDDAKTGRLNGDGEGGKPATPAPALEKVVA